MKRNADIKLENLGPWLDMKCGIELEHNYCDCPHCHGHSIGSCKQRTDFVVFLNLPDDKPYVVGTCAVHIRGYRDEGWATTPVEEFETKVRELIAEGVSLKDLPYMVLEKIEPSLTPYAAVQNSCRHSRYKAMSDGKAVRRHTKSRAVMQ